MDQLKTKKLIAGLNNSDVNSYNKLFEHYYEKVYNFCLKFLYQYSDAEEIAQEVFIVVWQNREKIDSKSSFSSYLFGVAKNKIYNIYRKHAYTESYINHKLGTGSEFDFVTEEAVMFNELNEIYLRLIQQLPEKRCEVFTLSRVEGLSYKEIATKLNISENTVDVQIRKALSFLRNGIRKYYQ